MFCPQCGKQIRNTANYCRYCGRYVADYHASQVAAQKPKKQPAVRIFPLKNGNDVLGSVGAVLSALLVGLLIAFLLTSGEIQSMWGALIPIASVFSFKMLGGKNGKLAIGISIAMCLIVPYLADRTAWAWMLTDAGYYEAFWEAFAGVPGCIETVIGETSYVYGLLMLYGLTGLGAYGTIRYLR